MDKEKKVEKGEEGGRRRSSTHAKHSPLDGDFITLSPLRKTSCLSWPWKCPERFWVVRFLGDRSQLTVTEGFTPIPRKPDVLPRTGWEGCLAWWAELEPDRPGLGSVHVSLGDKAWVP